MIGYITGKIIDSTLNQILIKTISGVGYFVTVSPFLDSKIGDNLEIYALEVYQDKKANALYGFDNLKDKKCVESLTKVGGVGPKTAATIVYTHGAGKILKAIDEGDFNLFKQVKGLGLKTAKKIILELKDSIKDLDLSGDGDSKSTNSEFLSSVSESLINMGYKKVQIEKAVAKIKLSGSWDESNMVLMIKLCLKNIS